MVKIKKIEDLDGYEVTHSSEEFPAPPADATVLWFALGWKPETKNTLHINE